MTTLLSLPLDILTMLLNHLPALDMICVLSTCKALYKIKEQIYERIVKLRKYPLRSYQSIFLKNTRKEAEEFIIALTHGQDYSVIEFLINRGVDWRMINNINILASVFNNYYADMEKISKILWLLIKNNFSAQSRRLFMKTVTRYIDYSIQQGICHFLEPLLILKIKDIAKPYEYNFYANKCKRCDGRRDNLNKHLDSFCGILSQKEPSYGMLEMFCKYDLLNDQKKLHECILKLIIDRNLTNQLKLLISYGLDVKSITITLSKCDYSLTALQCASLSPSHKSVTRIIQKIL